MGNYCPVLLPHPSFSNSIKMYANLTESIREKELVHLVVSHFHSFFFTLARVGGLYTYVWNERDGERERAREKYAKTNLTNSGLRSLEACQS